MRNQLLYKKSQMPKEIDKETLFPYKLNEILHNTEALKFLSWKKETGTIEITDLKGFEENVLPLYFRHARFESFVRQMNLYGFKKHRNSKIHIFVHEQLNTGINVLSLKSRYQKRRQTIIGEKNQRKLQQQFQIDEKKPRPEEMGNNSIQYNSDHRTNSRQEISMCVAMPQQYKNYILNNTFPFMGMYCFDNTWLSNINQPMAYPPYNQYQFFRS